MAQRITLSEPEEHRPFGSSVGYVVDYKMNEVRGLTIELSGREIDGHYILTKMIIEQPSDYGCEVFGVCHTSEEADLRLYKRAKEIAGEMAKKHQVGDLEDLTRHYVSLPRGGK